MALTNHEKPSSEQAEACTEKQAIRDAASFVSRLGWSIELAAEIIGCDCVEVGRYVQRGVPTTYLPTPDEIAEATQAIRATWTITEIKSRSDGYDDGRWAI